MAGAALNYYNERSTDLRVLTLTVNNACNLSCPHCYLQYDDKSGTSLISEDVVRTVLSSQFAHLAIVGKEPLFNEASRAICERLIFKSVQDHKTVSLITNGTRLSHLQPEALSSLTWLDISLDGGPDSYQAFRGVPYAFIVRQVNRALKTGLKAVNALHTLCCENIGKVDDLLAIAEDVPWTNIIFSPFVQVRNHGKISASSVSLLTVLRSLASNDRFMRLPNTRLILSSDLERMDSADAEHLVEEEIAALGMHNKIIMVKDNPLSLGYLRLTYDGYILSPYQSLHPASYSSFGILSKSDISLTDALASLKKTESCLC